MVPDEADAEDAAGVVADAAVSTALEVVAAADKGGICWCRAAWWCSATGCSRGGSNGVCEASATFVGLDGSWVRMPRTALAPDPLQ